MLSKELVNRRLVREAQITAQFDHPNIAKTLGAGFEKKGFFIAMELIRGQDLSAFLRRAHTSGLGLSPELAVGIADKTLEALQYAHTFKDATGRSLHVVHRDLSTRNIMITYEGEIKVIDFGAAKAKMNEELTNPGVLIGTPRYMSPEQARGQPVDHRTDLYTTSVVLYEMLTGRPVVEGQRPVELLMQVLEDMPPPVDTQVSGLPRGLGDVLHRGLHKELAERWPDAATYRRALRAVCDIPLDLQAQLKTVMQSLFASEKKAQEDLLKSHQLFLSGLMMADVHALTSTRSDGGLPSINEWELDSKVSSSTLETSSDPITFSDTHLLETSISSSPLHIPLIAPDTPTPATDSDVSALLRPSVSSLESYSESESVDSYPTLTGSSDSLAAQAHLPYDSHPVDLLLKTAPISTPFSPFVDAPVQPPVVIASPPKTTPGLPMWAFAVFSGLVTCFVIMVVFFYVLNASIT